MSGDREGGEPSGSPWVDSRGISRALGIVLLIALTLLLVSTVGVMTTGVFDEASESATYHGVGTFEYRFTETDGDSLTITPEAVSATGGTAYELRINGFDVREWDGTEPLRITCLYPGDRMLIRSEKGDTTYLVNNYTMDRSTQCERITPIDEKFEYAFINGDKERILKEWTFEMSINPDGTGSDSTYGNDVFEADIGQIPVTNEWHYIKRYTRPIEGFEPPVWVIVMTDNVHWRDGTNFDGYNWTDDPPGEPGIDSYRIDSGDVVTEPSGSEPTNDIYMVFKPGCDKSRIKVVDVSAGYENRIYVDGKVAISDTYEYSSSNPDRTDPPVTLDAPAVSC